MSTATLPNLNLDTRLYHPDDFSDVKLVVLSVLYEWGFLPSHQDQQELLALKPPQHWPDYFDTFVVAEDPNSVGIVGCAGLVKRDEATCELRKIYVLKRFRQHGVGSLLFNACKQYAVSLGYQTLRFEIDALMAEQSGGFFERQGFVRDPLVSPEYGSNNWVYFLSLSA